MQLTGTTVAYTGTFLELDSATNTVKYNPDVVNTGEAVHLVITAGIGVDYTQTTPDFTVSTACSATGYTIVEGTATTF